MSYNGWTNYETWNVALWIDNDESTYDMRQDMAERATDAYDLAQTLKAWIHDEAPNITGLYSDLLSAALSEVNWDEIAENWWQEAHEDDEKEKSDAS